MKKTTYEQLLDKVQQRSQHGRATRTPPSTPSGSFGRAPDYYPPDAEASLKLQQDIEERVREYSQMVAKAPKWLRAGWTSRESEPHAVTAAPPAIPAPVKPAPKTVMVNARDLKGGEIAVAITIFNPGYPSRNLKLPRSKVPANPVGGWCSVNDIVEVEVQEPAFNEWGENSL